MAITTNNNSAKLTSEQRSKLERQCAYEISRRSTPASLSYVAVLPILAFMSPLASEHMVYIYSAFALFGLTFFMRLILLLRFDAIYDYSSNAWYGLKGLAVLTTAVTWGSISAAAVYFYPASSTSLIASVCTAGMCAGGMYSLGMRLPFLYGFLGAMLLPNFIIGITVGGEAGTTLGTVFIIYLVYCIAQGKNINREYWDSRINAVLLDTDTEKRLHDLTYQDKLTGLPNRELYIDRLKQAALEAKRESQDVGVMTLGIDRFKKINDTLGQQSGNDVLVAVAKRLRECVRESDTVARLGGDIFAIILPNPDDGRGLAVIAQKILDKLIEPLEVNGLELVISASVGINVYQTSSPGGDTPSSILGNAEVAMYRAKEKGGNSYQYYEASMNEMAMENLQLESQLRKALEKDEFLLFYQPKVDLVSGLTCGFEALLRWSPVNRGIVSPGKFIPMLENTGLIVPVGEWVLRTACEQNKAWQDAGHPPVRVAVNLSVRQLYEQDIAYLVKCILDETGLDAQWLEIEITESILMNQNDQSYRMLNDLHDMGVHLSIDDFGTGYSSLSYLKRLPVSTLKIDRSFVQDITTDENDAAVVQAVVAMAHKLNLRVIAEGAETAEQIVMLNGQLCDEIQGFFFSKPVAPDEAVQFLVYNKFDQLEKLIKKQDSTIRIA